MMFISKPWAGIWYSVFFCASSHFFDPHICFAAAILALERELKDSGVMGVMYHKESLLDASILQGIWGG